MGFFTRKYKFLDQLNDADDGSGIIDVKLSNPKDLIELQLEANKNHLKRFALLMK
jgi:hypothetical protein